MGITRTYKFTENTKFVLTCDNCRSSSIQNFNEDVKDATLGNDWFKRDEKLFCKHCYFYIDYSITQLLDSYELCHRKNTYGVNNLEIEKIKCFIYRKVEEMKKAEEKLKEFLKGE